MENLMGHAQYQPAPFLSVINGVGRAARHNGQGAGFQGELRFSLHDLGGSFQVAVDEEIEYRIVRDVLIEAAHNERVALDPVENELCQGDPLKRVVLEFLMREWGRPVNAPGHRFQKVPVD